jgi:choline dehydrogenase-like flavoprotein
MNDLAAILRVEDSWHEQGRAGADKFIARLEKFPQGFFLTCTGDSHDQVVATITAMPVHYQADDVSHFSNWDKVTNNGYLHPVDLNACNALYIVSGVIDQRYRGQDIFAPMVLREVALAQALGLRYVLAGAVLPGYAKHCQRHGECAAHEYCSSRRGQHLLDPLLAMYDAIGFRVPDARHVLAEYFPDDASRNYAGLVVRDLHTHPLVSRQSD